MYSRHVLSIKRTRKLKSFDAKIPTDDQKKVFKEIEYKPQDFQKGEMEKCGMTTDGFVIETGIQSVNKSKKCS